MKYFAEDLKKVYTEERIMLALMILNIIASIVLLVFSIASLSPNVAVVKIGYGDIGGYRDGTWLDMLAFPVLAIIFGVFHNFIALNIYHKRGAGMTKFFILTTSALIAGTFVVLIRLLREG